MIKKIYLAGGCFWGVEGYFSQIEGIVGTEVGYANGNTENPSYEDVCRKNTGHAEAIMIDYDDSIISLEDILSHFLRIIDPYTLNRQGNDIGTQYRTGIYFIDQSDEEKILNFIDKKEKEYDENKKFVIEVEKLKNYYSAEEYHQEYLKKNPNGYCHINLNLAKKPL